jgi:hypothetical protein
VDGSPSWSQRSSLSFQTPDCSLSSTCSYTAVIVRESLNWVQDGPLVVNCTSGTGTCCTYTSVSLSLSLSLCVRACVRVHKLHAHGHACACVLS